MQYVHHTVVTLLAEKLRRYWIDTRGIRNQYQLHETPQPSKDKSVY